MVATTNDVESTPPELMRKGRFDEVFFVDLPSMSERVEIFWIGLSQHNLKYLSQHIEDFAGLTEGFSGAEIERVYVYDRRKNTTSGCDSESGRLLSCENE